jgi:lipid A 3-O-deacylase
VKTIIRLLRISAVRIAAAGALLLSPAAAYADDPPFLTVGLGWYDVNRQVDEATEFRAEYRHDKKIWIVKPFAGVMGTTDGAVYGYGGFLTDIFFGRRIVLTPSLAAGYYSDGNGRDLGHAIEFRSSIELAYRFDDRSRLGIAFYHLSNAHLGDTNPGTEILGVVYSIPLGPGS